MSGYLGIALAIAVGANGAGWGGRPLRLSPGAAAGTLVGGLVVAPGLLVGGIFLIRAQHLRSRPFASRIDLAPIVLPRGGGAGLSVSF